MTRLEKIRHSIAAELQPYPGRLNGTVLDVFAMLLALVLADTLRVPGMALALALILLLQRESPGITWRNILQIFGGSATACAVALFWVQMTDGTEVFRFLGLVLGVYIAAFCMSATRFPLFFTIFGFYGFVDLAGWDAHHHTNTIVTSMLYNLASLALSLGSAGCINFLFANRHPKQQIQEEMEKRLQLLASFHEEMAQPSRKSEMTRLHHSIVQAASSNDLVLKQLYEEWRSSSPEDLQAGVRFRIGLLTRVLERSSLVGFAARSDHEDNLRIAELCRSILNPSLPRPESLSAQAPTQLREIFNELSRYNEVAEDTDPANDAATGISAAGFRLFHSDAFTSSASAIYALKLTLCATTCYIIYNAIAWPGILTCVVTVLFTGLSSTGAMKQKQLYRFVGAAIGGGLAITVESIFYPNMDSITSLVIVAGLICSIGAWVSRSPRISYVGVQIAFAFFLTDIAGFGAVDQLAPARDRLAGIGLGILVMWFVFDLLWPTRPSDILRVIRDRTLHNAELSARLFDPSEIEAMRSEVSTDLAQMQTLIQSAWFDFSSDQHRELVRARQLTRQIEAAAAQFYRNLLAISSAEQEA